MLSELDDLRKNELFAALTDDELSTLTPLCSRFAVIEDGLVFREGTEASYLYLVVEGQIALQRPLRAPHGRRSRRTTVAVCRPPEVVGWSALVWPYKYTLSAVGWESSRLVRVDASMLRKALDMYPEVGYKVMRSLSALAARQLRQTTDSLITERAMALAGLKTPVSPGYELGSATTPAELLA